MVLLFSTKDNHNKVNQIGTIKKEQWYCCSQNRDNHKWSIKQEQIKKEQWYCSFQNKDDNKRSNK